MEKIARFGIDVTANPDADRQQHDVHRGEAGDGETAQQEAHGLGFRALAIGEFERMQLVAHAPQAGEGGCQIKIFVAPLKRQPAVSVIDSRRNQTRQIAQAAFDVANAGGAGHAFNRGVETIQPAIGFRHQRLVIESGGHACVSWLWR